jgi:hypothetical protein
VSRDLVVYARNETPLSSDDVLSALRSAGMGVEWRQIAPRPETRQPWRRAIVVWSEPGEGEQRLDVSTNPLGDEQRDYLAHHADLGAYRERVAAARRQYFIAAAPSARVDRVARTLAKIIAERSDGVVHDTEADRFYDAREPSGGDESRAGPADGGA